MIAGALSQIAETFGERIVASWGTVIRILGAVCAWSVLMGFILRSDAMDALIRALEWLEIPSVLVREAEGYVGRHVPLFTAIASLTLLCVLILACVTDDFQRLMTGAYAAPICIMLAVLSVSGGLGAGLTAVLIGGGASVLCLWHRGNLWYAFPLGIVYILIYPLVLIIRILDL